MVEAARKNTLLYSVVHQEVSLVIRVAHVGAVANRRDFKVRVEWRSEILVVDVQAVVGVILTSAVVPVCSLGRAVAFESPLLHEVNFLYVEVLLLVNVHVLQKVSDFALHRINASSNLLLNFDLSGRFLGGKRPGCKLGQTGEA